MDAQSRAIIGIYIGDRSRRSAQHLWQSLPRVYRQCAMCYTDFWEAYAEVLPSKRHRAVDKDSGKTSYIERFNNTLRQRVGRLVRKTLSFSKKLTNHVGAIWYFMHYYNASLQDGSLLLHDYQNIYLFRFDDQIGDVYILAGNELEIVVPPNGIWEFL